MISTGTRRLLANRYFLCLWISQTLTRTAFNLVTFALIIWVFELTQVNIAVSLWLLARLIPSATLGIFAGVVVDAYDRKRLMIIANLLWGLTALAYVTVKNSFVGILLITAVAQGIDEFFVPAQLSILPRLVAKRDLLPANSLLSLSMYAATVVGFVLSGFLLRFFGFGAPFVFATFLILLGIVFVTFLPSAYAARATALGFPLQRTFISYFRREAKKGVTFCFSHPLAFGTLLFVALLLVGEIALGTLAPGFMEEGLGIDAKDISFVGGIPASLGLVLGTILLGRLHRRGWRSQRLIRAGLFMLGVTSLALATISVLRPYLVGYTSQVTGRLALPHAFEQLPGISLLAGILIFIAGTAATFIAVPTLTFLQKTVPDAMRGRIFGLLGTATAILQGLVTLILGAAADFITPAPLVAAFGFLTLGTALFRERLLKWFLAMAYRLGT